MSYTPRRRPASYRRSQAGAIVGTSLIVAAVVVIGGGQTIAAYSNTTTQTCTVEEKDRTTNSDGDSDMRVYTAECGVLRVQDMMLGGEFNSSDTFSDLKEGETYTITTTGYRVGLFSMFPIVRDVQPAR